MFIDAFQSIHQDDLQVAEGSGKRNLFVIDHSAVERRNQEYNRRIIARSQERKLVKKEVEATN